MLSKDEVWKEIRPKLPNWLDTDQREELLSEIGDYVTTAVLDYLADGFSPVKGVGGLALLSDKYADEEKGGDKTPNLELNGDMLSSLTYENDAYSVKIGIWDEDQAIKAYGHMTGMEGHPFLDGKVPVRKLLPRDREKFTDEIQEGIDLIIEEYLADADQNPEEAQGS